MEIILNSLYYDKKRDISQERYSPKTRGTLPGIYIYMDRTFSPFSLSLSV